MGGECEFKKDFFDGLRCTKCTYPMIGILRRVEGTNLYEDMSEALD